MSADPRYDPELAALLRANPEISRESLRSEEIVAFRKSVVEPDISEIADRYSLSHRELVIAGFEGVPMTVSVIARSDHSKPGPGIVSPHPGGMIVGSRFFGVQIIADWVERFDAVAILSEYRLAPEHQDPAPIEDCYASLLFTNEHADELGIDPTRIIVAGMSAGGGLAAGLALMSRDRGGPTLAGQMLMCPMLDESNSSASSHQFVDLGLWDRDSNEVGWNALLGERRHTDAVTSYASPSRATDFTNLPPAFIDVGSMEIFRDEDCNYARDIWAAGGDAELHVWPGAFHGLDINFPDTVLARRTAAARREWLERVFEQRGT